MRKQPFSTPTTVTSCKRTTALSDETGTSSRNAHGAAHPESHDMPARAHAIAEHIAERLAQAATEDMYTRYDLGQLAHRIRYDGSGDFSARTLVHLATYFDMHISRLGRYARVAEV